MMEEKRFYGRKMKLADMVLADCNLLNILERMEIKLGFGEATVDEVCRRYGYSTDFFLMICRIYSFRDYEPDNKSLKRDDLRSLLLYLSASHRYYLETCFPELTRHMAGVAALCDRLKGKILTRFYDEYAEEVRQHFAYEERRVFPYIRRLLGGEGGADDDYDIAQFERNHSDIDEKLNDLKNIIVKYLPEECPVREMNKLLFSINALEEDLRRHTLIENRLLIPLVLKIENDG